MWVAFAKATHIFSAKMLALYAIFNDQSFNNTVTKDIVSFEQLGPGFHTGRARAVSNALVLALISVFG